MSYQPLRVTAVTLSFNQRPFLERAVRSVLEQDYPVEYIVVDPGSTDGSRALIERYRPRLTRVVLEPDAGPADGLNKALSLATGDAFVCVNGDDALLPGAVRSAVAALARHPDAAAVYADGYLVDDGGRPIRRIRSTDFDLRRFVFGGVNVMQQTTFIRRDAFLEVGSQRLTSEYKRDRLRMFTKVIGRTPHRGDWIAFARARVEKWVRDPRYLVWRVTDAVRRPRPARAAP
jgi:glycosyltransferase involved in cell wall biosynthesis